MEWQIRRGEPRDAPVLVSFNQAMALETENLRLDADIVSAGVQGLIAQPALGFYLLAENHHGILGSLMITYEWSDWRNGLIWWFQSVYVRPEYRRSGVFRDLYQQVRAQAHEAGARGLRLYVEQNNQRALATYRQLGMQDSHYFLLEEMFSDGSTPAS